VRDPFARLDHCKGSWLYRQRMHAHVRSTLIAVDAAALEAAGIHTRHLGLDPTHYQPALDELKGRRGYHTQDEVRLSSATPDLAAVLKKFDAEHAHADDEVRFVLDGAGVFDIRDRADRMIRVVVEAGDLIVVPARTHHRFELTDACRIHAIRLFKDAAGWVPEYRTDPPPV
jgi:1,2-dihydroxy-3-keto-5-methylthiopentene dioxygenase